MKLKTMVIIGISLLVIIAGAGYIFLKAISGMGSPTGGRGPDYPYFITRETTVIKHIKIPRGTKLTYEEQFWKKGELGKMLSEKKLTRIELPAGQYLDWGGVPVCGFYKFFNKEMKGYGVKADFNKLKPHQQSEFSRLWQHCNDELDVLVKDTDNWSFDKKNITDVTSCSVNYQRYFKDDKKQQDFLDELFIELKAVRKQ